ncbi:LapA family protein [Novosphingobium sp. 9]|uniref:LapA family protein n=1 Tax=Novosphingobium sp. 9 TaxID=2025349 RepID=UPI0021B5B319|nr:LapA family protein [Novosphingobium sp. 9]
MQIIRTIAWIVLTIILVAFVAMNWTKVVINLWPLGNGYVNVVSRMGYFIILFVAVGFVPMWLYYRGMKWKLTRRIASLENTVRALTPSEPVAAAPVATAQVAAEPAPLTTPAEPIAPGFETRPDTQP